MFEDTLEYKDFLDEWKPDGLNIPVQVWWIKDDKEMQVVFAHPRKLTMSQISVTGMSKKQAIEWLDKHHPAKIKVEDL